MNKLLASVTLAVLFQSVVSVFAAASPPNIIVILCDDMGYSDLGCMGGEIQTPRLDSLAHDGIRFTQFYNAARCCPTRASLLTGLYPHQTGMGHTTNDKGYDGYRGDLNGRCVTIAEVLRDSGYRTYAVGKWHVTRNAKPESEARENWPLQRGFDKYYGVLWGSSSYFEPTVWRGNQAYPHNADPEYKPDEFYLTTAFSDNAVTFLREHDKESPRKPFFMYMAYTAAHWPMQAPEQDIARYRGKYNGGYEQVRRERLGRMRSLGLLDPRWDPAPTAKEWDAVEIPHWEARCMEVYAAMVEKMDQGVGKIVDELKRQKRFDNTLILFLQDNGGCAEEMGRGELAEAPADLRALRPDEFLSGHPKQTRDGRPMRHGAGVMPGPVNTFLAYGEGWANVSNTPFREYKHWVHEGGISTPLIAHWPAGIAKSQRDKLESSPAHLIDIMATCVDVAGASYPEESKWTPILPMEGTSLLPAFSGKPIQRKNPLFWEHEGNRAIREGNWKLVAKEDKPWELYDMQVDRTEMHDLATSRPELVTALAAKWDEWAARASVLPLGGWRKVVTATEPSKPIKLHLKLGDELEAEKAPNIVDAALTITARLQSPVPDGVILAQGGASHGYVLSIRDGSAVFEVRRKKALARIQDPEPATSGTITACLGVDGSMRLLRDGREVAAKHGGGPIPEMPKDPLSVGKDTGAAVGKYYAPFPFTGTIESVSLEVGK